MRDSLVVILTYVTAKLLILLVPLGVLDPEEQQVFNRRDSLQRGGKPHTSSETSSGTSVSSPVTPHLGRMLTDLIASSVMHS